jgi:AAA+ ATPase superfamily predicted ATPase
MNSKIKNPFITGGYVSPEYFCDRKEEAEKLLKAISSRRNLTLISLRRMGKTGLLKHVRHILEETQKNTSVVYIDLMPTTNAGDMLNAVSSALVRVKREERNFFEKILSGLSRMRPKLTYDPLTGQPSVELKIDTASDIQYGLNSLMRYFSDIKQDLVFMFDEFQQISNYPEKNTEQILRTIIQSYPTMPFIFSGSSKHMLEPMFLSASRPFYQSSELMYLDRIPEPEYRKFIVELLAKGNKKIEEDVLFRILKWTRGHTFYVQYVFNSLFENDAEVISHDVTGNVFHDILTAYEPLYLSFRDLLPNHQFRLLLAIAAEDGITQPNSGSFISKHNLTSASSVATSMRSLAGKEMIVNDGGKWIVYDVFFSRWLSYYFNK